MKNTLIALVCSLFISSPVIADSSEWMDKLKPTEEQQEKLKQMAKEKAVEYDLEGKAKELVGLGSKKDSAASEAKDVQEKPEGDKAWWQFW